MSTDEKATTSSLHADRPIRKSIDDKLGRSGFAKSIAHQIQRAPRGDSYVLGLVGPWGSGKTSILNMIEEELRADSSMLFLSFNPWLFSGHKELVAHFFHEIAAQIRDKDQGELRDIWRGFEGYSRLLRPLRAIPGAETSGAEAREPSLRRQREVLDDALARARHRLVVVIDDLDRLENEEIRDVMKLVRLLADFPNTIYLLSYDEMRVAEALGGDDKQKGRSFLEKIVQVAHHVPEIRGSDLSRILNDEVDAILNTKVDLELGDKSYLLNTYHAHIRPLFEGLRDVYRYINALGPSLEQIGHEIVIADLLALEALRILAPDVLNELIVRPELRAAPAQGWTPSARDNHAQRQQSTQALFDRAGKRAQRVERLLKILFPAMDGSYGSERLGRWKKERRVAHPEVFQIYIDRIIPEGEIETRFIRHFIENLNRERVILDKLESMHSLALEKLFARLEDYEGDLHLDENGDAIRAFLDQLPRLREGTSQFFDYGAKMALTRIVLRLLRPLDPSKITAIVERQFPRIQSLSGRLVLLDSVRADETSYRIDGAKAKALEMDLARAVLDASTYDLSRERDLMLLLHNARQHHEVAVTTKIGELAGDDAAMLRMLTSGMSETRTGAWGSVVSTVEYVLSWWDDLEQIVGKELLQMRIEALNSRRGAVPLADRDGHAVDTALKYVGGWRPKNYLVTQGNGSKPIVLSEGEENAEGSDDNDDELT